MQCGTLQEMSEIRRDNFGVIIAYLLPGMIALWGISFLSETVRAWFGATGENAATVGGFMHVALASLAAGLLVGAVGDCGLDSPSDGDSEAGMELLSDASRIPRLRGAGGKSLPVLPVFRWNVDFRRHPVRNRSIQRRWIAAVSWLARSVVRICPRPAFLQFAGHTAKVLRPGFATCGHRVDKHEATIGDCMNPRPIHLAGLDAFRRLSTDGSEEFPERLRVCTRW